MSLENEIKKLIAAVEANTKALEIATFEMGRGTPVQLKSDTGDNISHMADVVAPIMAAPAPAPTPNVAPAPVVAPAPAPAAQAPAAVDPVTATVVTMTAEELNSALVTEFNRLGSRDPIMKVMSEYGVGSVNDLAVNQYAPVLAAVKAL